ncbi:MAG: hypothetical protein BGO77_00860 [Caedibacter sp. 37-49]|nr:MAG: hypothetical protein BGO77_00860 [Caedibacter sp. 37-49]
MTYLIELKGFQAELCTSELLKTHGVHLKTLYHEKKILFCGPCKDGSALFLFSTTSQQEVLNLLNQDPFIIYSIYQFDRIKEMRLATLENQFLLNK